MWLRFENSVVVKSAKGRRPRPLRLGRASLSDAIVRGMSRWSWIRIGDIYSGLRQSGDAAAHGQKSNAEKDGARHDLNG